MEKLRKLVNEIAYTQDQTKLTPLHSSLTPLLSFVSSLYGVALSFRRFLHRSNLLSIHRLQVPVISVGNLTWGGNGKTPMVEFIARQHWSLWRDLEIVMVNGLMPWGNCQLLPLGPLREPLTGLRRADAVVIHNADLVSDQNLKNIELEIQEIKNSLPIFFTRMAPSYLFQVGRVNSKIPLSAMSNAVVLCVSAIGSANAFVQVLGKLGACHVDRLDYSDHHLFQPEDIETIRKRLVELQGKFGSKPLVVVTEKDYDRDPEILKHLGPSKVLVLHSKLQFLTDRGCSEDSFKSLLKRISRGEMIR